MLRSLIGSNGSRGASAPLRPLCLLLAVVACNDGGSPELDTGLPPDTSLGDLTADEVRKACEGFEDLANDLVGPDEQHYLGCVAAGIATELAGAGECADARDNCLDNGTNTAEPIDLMCEGADPLQLDGCDATVGQLEACADDLAAAADSVLDSVSCALVDDPDGLEGVGAELEVAFDPSSYDTCNTLADACLAFLDLPPIDLGGTAE